MIQGQTPNPAPGTWQTPGNTSLVLFGIIALVLIITLFTPCARGAAPTFTPAEQAVIEAIISQEAKGSNRHVIEDTTSSGMSWATNYAEYAGMLRHDAAKYDGAFKEALEDFIQKNSTNTQIVFPTNPPKNIELLPRATHNEFWADKKADGWKKFYDHFPGVSGIITISRVGIDAKGKVAIIYFGRQSGGLSGSGGTRVLRRKAGKWELTHESIGPTWIS